MKRQKYMEFSFLQRAKLIEPLRIFFKFSKDIRISSVSLARCKWAVVSMISEQPS